MYYNFITDIEPPKISNCDKVTYNYAQRNSTLAVLTWNPPTVNDNHDLSIALQKDATIKIGDKVEAGSYDVRYSATDDAGNQAIPCKMKIVVKGWLFALFFFTVVTII